MERVEEKVQRLLAAIQADHNNILNAAVADPRAWQDHWEACRRRLPPGYAIKVMLELQRLRPDASGIQGCVAELYIQLGDLTSASANVEPQLAAGETRHRLLRLHAEIAQRAQRIDQVRARYERLLQHHPGDPSTTRDLAKACANLGDLAAAVAWMQSFVEEETALPADHLTLLTYQASQQDRRLLPAETRALVARFPDDPLLIKRHLTCLRFHREFEEAEAFLQKREQEDAGESPSASATTRSFREEQELEIAEHLERYAARPLKLHRLAEICYLLGRSGRRDLAETLLDGLGGGVDSDHLLLARAELHLLAEEIPEALACLRRAVALCPNLTNGKQLCSLQIDCGCLKAAQRRLEGMRDIFAASRAGEAALEDLTDALQQAQADDGSADRPARPPAAERYVVDIGAHRGEDSDFYLRKGFKVVTVEAFPGHVAWLRDRFSEEIEAGNCFIEAVAIGARDEMGSFFVHHEKTDWHRASLDPAEGRGSFREIEVRFSSVGSLLKKYPTPYYVKVDIEGNDHFVIEALTAARRPTYLSFELAPGWEDWVAHLIAVGYRQGQIVDQSRFDRLRSPYPPREGRYAWTHFTGHMSGLFGRDLPANRWMNIADLEAVVNALPYGKGEWYDVHVR